MIRTVALGVVCLAGLGVIAAAAKKSTPPPSPEVVMPAVSGNKADRLPLKIDPDPPTEVDKVEVVSVSPPEASQPAPVQSAPTEIGTPPPAKIISRHWHDRSDVKAKTAKQKASTKQSPSAPAVPVAKQVAPSRECRSDGLRPLLAMLNLSPGCDS
jgi:hypothetical protein